MSFRRYVRVGALAAMVLSAGASHAAGQDPVSRAQGLATAGQHGEAIILLVDALTATPGNSDARVLLGTVLSWAGRYDEARKELEAVLSTSPVHGDALVATINVELWSAHPGRAEELASRGLRSRPNDAGLLLARARALAALQRQTEARDTLDHLLIIDPRNDEARQMRRSLSASMRLWQLRVGSFHDAFSDDRVAWREEQVSLGRETPIGSVILRGARAHRFGLRDEQFEIEAYPRFRPGSYANVSAAYSPDAVLYPEYRYAADLYQSLGAGFEGSAGFRRLGFGRGVNIYTGSLNKYYGDWLFTGRAFVTPNAAGTARSYQGSFRRYFSEAGTFVGLRYGRGAWREELRNRRDFEILDSDVASAEGTVILGGRLELNVTGSYSRENRPEQRDLRQYSLSTGFGFRF